MSRLLNIETIKQKLTDILSTEPVYKAILFGSYAKGNADSKSDIDLVIDSRGALCGLRFFGVLEKIKNTLCKKIDLIEISEIEEGSEIEKVILREGIVIYDRKNWEMSSQNEWIFY